MALLCEGQRIRNTYEVERFLGEGAFAEVYRVQHRFLGRQAMKVFKQAEVTLEEIQDMLGEASLLSRIGHPNIIRVFDANVFECNGKMLGFFTMEYVPGGSLDRHWQGYGRNLMPVQEAVEILKQVCSGLAVAHAETPPVIHRDIKPQNILVGYDGSGLRVRVSDFGLARRVNPLTMLASARGTPSFKPPESFENIDSCAADVWSLGTTFYLLLTDTLPYPCLNREDFTDKSRFLRPLRPASTYNIQVDAALQAILTRALAIKPEDRYPDAGALLSDLTRWKPVDVRSRSRPDESSTSNKAILGEREMPNEVAARAAIAQAKELARIPGKLMEAADMLEEVIGKNPVLREQYETQLKLWRRGVSM